MQTILSDRHARPMLGVSDDGLRLVVLAPAGMSLSESEIRAITLGASNEVILGNGTVDLKLNKATVALGAGAAASFGTIGTPGPLTAAQNGWLRFLDSTGAACWVPFWK